MWRQPMPWGEVIRRNGEFGDLQTFCLLEWPGIRPIRLTSFDVTVCLIGCACRKRYPA